MATTIFRPNAVSTDIAYDAGLGRRRGQCGGAMRTVEDEIVTFKSNESNLPWHGESSPTVAKVGAARSIANAIDKRWRTMFRFVMRAQFIEVNALVSGPVPEVAWWAGVTGARLKWFNGDQMSLEAGIGSPILTSGLKIRAGRGLYTPTGAFERPFGKDNTEAGASYAAALSFGSEVASLAWADWADPSRTWRTLEFTETMLDTLIRNVTGPTDDYVDFSFYLASEGVDQINVARAIAAWDPNAPLLEVDFADAEEHVDPAAAFLASVAAEDRVGEVEDEAREHDVQPEDRVGAVDAENRVADVQPEERA